MHVSREARDRHRNIPIWWEGGDGGGDGAALVVHLRATQKAKIPLEILWINFDSQRGNFRMKSMVLIRVLRTIIILNIN